MRNQNYLRTELNEPFKLKKFQGGLKKSNISDIKIYRFDGALPSFEES